MKALTLWQPWAQFVAVGYKTIETRGWRTNYRGPLAIHAAKRLPSPRDSWAWGEVNRWAKRPFPFDLVGPFDALPLGAVVAFATLVDVLPIGRTEAGQVTVDGHPWRTGPTADRDSLAELRCGDFMPGRWAWLLADIVLLEEPIPAKGRQGLWEWEP